MVGEPGSAAAKLEPELVFINVGREEKDWFRTDFLRIDFKISFFHFYK